MTDKICADFLEKGLALCDDFVSPAEIEALLEKLKTAQGNMQKARIGNKQNYRVNGGIRGDLIQWLEPENDALFKKIYLDKLQEVIAAFNRSFYLGISKSEHHITVYPPGTHYQKHVDTFKKTDARIVSSVLYLNKNWLPKDGGELLICLSNGETQKIEPIAGRLVLFESTLEHEVLLCNAHRYSVTGWFKRDTLF